MQLYIDFNFTCNFIKCYIQNLTMSCQLIIWLNIIYQTDSIVLNGHMSYTHNYLDGRLEKKFGYKMSYKWKKKEEFPAGFYE